MVIFKIQNSKCKYQSAKCKISGQSWQSLNFDICILHFNSYIFMLQIET